MYTLGAYVWKEDKMYDKMRKSVYSKKYVTSQILLLHDRASNRIALFGGCLDQIGMLSTEDVIAKWSM